MRDSLGLTPDYRLKVKQVRELYLALLRDFREMRIAFYDQLGAELRHAGCKVEGFRVASEADPSNPASWELGEGGAAERRPEGEAAHGARQDDDAETDGESDGPPLPTQPPRAAPEPEGKAGGAGERLTASVWIQIDNSRCSESSRLSIDGAPLGDIAGHKRASIRTHAGPHQLCVLPASDPRPCGAPGTVRKAYLHEGWSIAVRCGSETRTTSPAGGTGDRNR